MARRPAGNYGKAGLGEAGYRGAAVDGLAEPGLGETPGLLITEWPASMPEMPHAREHHRDACRVGGGDHLGVAQRAAGLDDGGGAGFDRRDQSVGEREERVGGDDRASSRGSRPAAASLAFCAATRAELTRDICPAPTPTVAPLLT